MPSKERYWKNPEYYQEKTREYNTQNASRMAETSKAWAEKNADKVYAIKRRYYLKNKKLTIQKNQQRRKALKIQCIGYLGGICNKCRLDTDCLDIYCFHHRDPSEKDFSISSRRTSTLEKIQKELDKCELLCANCHRKEHMSIKMDIQTRCRRKRKASAVAIFGGICADCGLEDDPCVYDFHHPDASKKDFNFRDNRNWETTVEELLKCVMLCVNCHKRRHYGSPLQNFSESSQA